VADKSQPLDALRLPEAEQLHILQELDASASQPATGELRINQRYRYRIREGLAMQVPGFQFQFIVRPRNLSAGGISVLHGGFLYAGTACTILLRTIAGKPASAEGKIVRCRCIRGRAHELNIHFDQPIEIENYVDLGKAPVAAGPATAYSSAQVTLLAHRLEELASAQAPLAELVPLMAQLTTLLSGAHL
jgi:hypothetical protein